MTPSIPFSDVHGDATSSRGGVRLGRVFGLELRYELLKLLRMPVYAVPTLAFPLMFYGLFGLAFTPPGPAGVGRAAHLMATYGVFGVLGATLFGLGVGLAVERGQGWMLFKRATPMPVAVHFAARIAVTLVFGLVIVLGLAAMGRWLGGVELAASSWLRLAATLVAIGLPFAATGLALGYLCGPSSAPAVVNAVFLPVSFASGLWIPVALLPAFFQGLAPWLPPYHAGQLALGAIGSPTRTEASTSIVVLAAWTVVSLGVARWAYRRDEGTTTYG